MQEEEADLSFTDFSIPSARNRLYTAPLFSEGPDSENAPDLTAEGVNVIWSTRPGSNRRPSAWECDGGRETALEFVL
jgi:hypothetical protein